MTPPRILTAIHLGLHALSEEHAALKLLWRKFSHAMRDERRKRRIKLKDFAEKMGISPTYLAYMESGLRPWTVERAELAVKLLTRREQWPN